MIASSKTRHHLARVEGDLRRRFPFLPREQVSAHMTEIANELLADARFDDYIPVLTARRARDDFARGS